MDYKKIVSTAILDAHVKGWLNVGNILNLKSIEIEESRRDVKSMVGRIKYNSRSKEYSIILYLTTIGHAVKNKHHINGLLFIDVNDAIDCVLKHELCHIINDFNGGNGHDNMFKQIAFDLFNHTSVYVEEKM